MYVVWASNEESSWLHKQTRIQPYVCRVLLYVWRDAANRRVPESTANTSGLPRSTVLETVELCVAQHNATETHVHPQKSQPTLWSQSSKGVHRSALQAFGAVRLPNTTIVSASPCMQPRTHLVHLLPLAFLPWRRQATRSC
jgi:hypothetical protein